VDKRLKYGYVFERTAEVFDKGTRVIIHKGGTGSGKTFDLMIFIIVYIAMKMEGKVITVVSESYPHLDIGAIRIAKSILMQLDMTEKVKFNSSKNFFLFPSGSLVEFFSADRIDKALGARRFLLYGNEINSLKFDVWDELARRSEVVIGDFNPTAEFWLEKFLLYYDQYEVIKSNYLNNPFLPEVERQRIEKRAELDPNFRRTHVDVEYGSMEGLIFHKFEQVDRMPRDYKWQVYGMDFGFTNDPTALIRVVLSGGELWMDELIYSRGLTNQDIARSMGSLGLKWEDEVIADNQPKCIFEIRKEGFNVQATYKGRDSILAGIDILQRYKLNVTKRSVNLIRELRNYRWKEDQAGNSMNVPVDRFNHAIDAARYAVMAKVMVNRKRMVKVGRV